MKKTKQLENFFNSMTEDIFNMTEEEIDEELTEMGYDPKKVGDSAWQLIKELQKLKEAKTCLQAPVIKSVCVRCKITESNGKSYFCEKCYDEVAT